MRQWVTPTATDGTGGAHSPESIARRKAKNGAGNVSLRDQTRAWPTPTASEARHQPTKHTKGGSSLTAAARTSPVSARPTPAARDFKSGSVSEATLGRNSRPLSEVAFAHTDGPPDLQTETHGLPGTMGLNPEFVEALMGLPRSWSLPRSASTPSATVSSPNRQLSLFSSAGSGSSGAPDER